ncbi:hypothetical protein HK101_002666 [Irineochytrium annulatum]|nr:hypothetical protein HK101_002666 [Irineochytrium annulatum]
MVVSTVNASTPWSVTLKPGVRDASMLVANIDLPTSAIPSSTQAYYQYVLTDLLSTSGSAVRATLCAFGSSDGTVVGCSQPDLLGSTCIHQQCAFPVPRSGSFPASTYEIGIWVCLSTVGPSDCASVEETFPFTELSTLNFTISNNGVWTGSWGSTTPGPSAAAFTEITGNQPGSSPTASRVSTAAPSTSSAANTSSSSSSSSNTKIIIAIAAAAGAVIIAIIAAVVFCYRRSRKSKYAPTASDAPLVFQKPYGGGGGDMARSTTTTTFFAPPEGSSMMAMSPQSHPAGLQHLPSMRQPDFSTPPTPHEHHHHHQEQQYVGGGGGGGGASSSMMSYTSNVMSPVVGGGSMGPPTFAPVVQGGTAAAGSASGASEKQGLWNRAPGASEKQGLWNPAPAVEEGPSLPAYDAGTRGGFLDCYPGDEFYFSANAKRKRRAREHPRRELAIAVWAEEGAKAHPGLSIVKSFN